MTETQSTNNRKRIVAIATAAIVLVGVIIAVIVSTGGNDDQGGDNDNGQVAQVGIWDREQAEKDHEAIADRFQNALAEGRSTEPFLEPARQLALKYPKFDQAHALYAHVLHVRKRNEEALIEIDKSIALNPKQAELASLAGAIAAAVEKYDTSIEHFKNAIYLEPDKIKFRLLLAQVQIDANRRDDARDTLLKVLEKDSNAHKAYFMLSDLFSRDGKFQLALSKIDDAIEHVPAVSEREDFLRYVRHKAKLLRRQNRYDEALLVLRDNLTYKSERTDPDVVHEMGILLALLNRPAEAAGVFEEAILAHETDEDVLKTLLHKAAVYRIRAGNLKLARAHIEKLRTYSPNLPAIADLEAMLKEKAIEMQQQKSAAGG